MDILHKFKEIFSKSHQSGRRYQQKYRRDVLSKMHQFTEGNPRERWEVLGSLGDGAEAQVFKLKSIPQVDGESIKFAAAKVIKFDDADEYIERIADEKVSLISRQSEVEEELSSYLTEIFILRQCKHENIVQMLESYYFEDRIWIIEEYCDAGALDSLMASVGSGLPESAISHVSRCVLSAIDYLHSNVKVIHRDLKAGNIMVTKEGGVKLADFGVAAVVQNKNQRRYSFIGSSYWMAPEVIICETNKCEGYSFEVDIWSFGITAIELAEMNPPHYQMNHNRVLIRILRHGTPSLTDPDQWSLNFRNFLKAALEVKPELRPTAAQLLQHEFINDRNCEQSKRDFISYTLRANVESINIVNGVEPTVDKASDCIPVVEAPVCLDEWKESDEEDSDHEVNRSDEIESSSDQIMLKNMRLLDEVIEDAEKNGPENQMAAVVIQSSPVDVYKDVDIADLHSTESIEFDIKAESIAAAINGAILLEKTSFSDIRCTIASLIYEDIVAAVIGSDRQAPSIPDVIVSCLDDMKSIQENQTTSPLRQYEVIRNDNLENIPDCPNCCDFEGMYLCDDVNHLNDALSSLSMAERKSNHYEVMSYVGRVKRRREESRDFRHCFQMQEKRLSQLKLKQQAELRARDHGAASRRQKLLERIACMENDLYNEQQQEIESLEQELCAELKNEIKRKKSEIDKSFRRFVETQREEASIAKRNLDPQLKNELDARLINRVEQFQQMQRQELEDYARNIRLYHQERISLLKLSCAKRMQQAKKDNLKRLFDLEEREICDKFQLLCSHVKEFYSTMRGYMHANQKKELEELDEASKLEREAVINDWNLRRRNAIKYMREVFKTREKQYLQSLSIYGNLSTEEERRRLKKFTEAERVKMQQECYQRDRAIEHKINQLFVKHQQRKEQLLSVQAQRRAQCAEKEAQKISEVQMSYANQLKLQRAEFERQQAKLHPAMTDMNDMNVPMEPTVIYTSEHAQWYNCNCVVHRSMNSDDANHYF